MVVHTVVVEGSEETRGVNLRNGGVEDAGEHVLRAVGIVGGVEEHVGSGLGGGACALEDGWLGLVGYYAFSPLTNCHFE